MTMQLSNHPKKLGLVETKLDAQDATTTIN
jgi:hypothetical protein